MRAAALAALAIAQGGCMLTAKHEVTSTIAYDYRLRHPISIQEGDRIVELFVGMRRGTLTPTQRAELRALAQSWKREATGGIAIEMPTGTPNARAAAEAGREARDVLAEAGVPTPAISIRHLPNYEPSRLSTVKVAYPKMVARAGPCGRWPADLGPTSDTGYTHNEQHWNYGCATQRNLAAMVEDPADLVQPRAETPIYGARRTTVLEKFRRGETTATAAQNADKGKISDVGK
jgi:pilus assembly protein CpaD